MDIIEAMQATMDRAKETGNLCYLYETPNLYEVSLRYRKDWLFKAYPGGRKVLSRRGHELVTKLMAD